MYDYLLNALYGFYLCLFSLLKVQITVEKGFLNFETKNVMGIFVFMVWRKKHEIYIQKKKHEKYPYVRLESFIMPSNPSMVQSLMMPHLQVHLQFGMF